MIRVFGELEFRRGTCAGPGFDMPVVGHPSCVKSSSAFTVNTVEYSRLSNDSESGWILKLGWALDIEEVWVL